MSGKRDSAELEPTHKVRVGNKFLNQYEDNPDLIGGAFATLFPLGLTKDDIGKGGSLPPKLVRTWLKSYDRRFAKHPLLIILYSTRRSTITLTSKLVLGSKQMIIEHGS